MRILLLANINSSHTRKWASNLKEAGLAVGVVSLNPFSGGEQWFKDLDYVYHPPRKFSLFTRYPILYRQLKKAIGHFKPDVLHSHFLTNYSFLGCLTGFRPHLATSWGSDVYKFPKEGKWQKAMFMYNLKHADAIISTSRAMAAEINKYTSRQIHVIPFGIDLGLFTRRISTPLSNERMITLGCFKKLEPIYRPDVLIRSFHLLTQRMANYRFKLIMAGDGKLLPEMKLLSVQLGISQNIEFTGWVTPKQVAERLQETDVAVYLSATESFGVSLLEAMASGVPMVLTKTPGFLEVMESTDHALFVDVDNVEQTTEALVKLITDKELYERFVEEGLQRVKKSYNLEENIRQQTELYRDYVNRIKSN